VRRVIIITISSSSETASKVTYVMSFFSPSSSTFATRMLGENARFVKLSVQEEYSSFIMFRGSIGGP
jgi:hypothetical protein